MNDQPQRAMQEEPVAWRWRLPDSKNWIYDPSPEWREDFKDDPSLVFEPLYATASGADVRAALELAIAVMEGVSPQTEALRIAINMGRTALTRPDREKGE